MSRSSIAPVRRSLPSTSVQFSRRAGWSSRSGWCARRRGSACSRILSTVVQWCRTAEPPRHSAGAGVIISGRIGAVRPPLRRARQIPLPFEGLRRHLPGLSGAEKEPFPTRQGAEAGLLRRGVRIVQDRLSIKGESPISSDKSLARFPFSGSVSVEARPAPVTAGRSLERITDHIIDFTLPFAQ